MRLRGYTTQELTGLADTITSDGSIVGSVPGPVGPQGPQGIQGPPGPTDVYGGTP